MKYVAGLFNKIPTSQKSHSFGWSKYWADGLGAVILRDFASLTRDDTLYIDHGVNFSGGLNLFGGVNDEMVEQLQHILSASPRIISLDIVMPNYCDMLENRIGAPSSSKLLTTDFIRRLRGALNDATTQVYPYTRPTWVTCGDSHSTAYARRGSEVHRENGLTLYGLLNDWQRRFIDTRHRRYENLIGITIVVGSIDVRHHLLRQHAPRIAATTLIKQLCDRACELEQLGYRVELCVPVPVEDECRRIPKTGYYKGTPFFGSVSERQDMTMHVRDELIREWDNVISPQLEWYTMDPIVYAKEIMERGGSVHIAPTQYRSNTNGWV